MDNHPIPQDVTGFQFKLIGSMTLKQFAYIAAGGVLALLFFSIVKNSLVKWPLVLMFAGSGVALAFVPYEGRPLDEMVAHFFRAVFNPTQYLYEKMGGHIAIATIAMHPVSATTTPGSEAAGGTTYSTEDMKKNQQLQAYLQTIDTSPQNDMDQKELDKIKSVYTLVGPAPVAAPIQPAVPVAAQVPVASPVQPVAVPRPVVQTIQTAPAPQAAPQTTPPQEHEPVEIVKKEAQTISTQLDDIVSEKKQLENELQSLKAELAQHKQQVQQTQQPAPQPQPAQGITQPQDATQVTQAQQAAPAVQTPARSQLIEGLPTAATPAARTARPTTFARKLTKASATTAGLPNMPDAPNIIMGIIKDPRGNAITNVLVEIKDKDGNPIRAFKTNLLGQFASATPLPNGIYTIEFEDPKGAHTLSPIQIEAKGEVMLPIEVVSVDAREVLRQELFG